MKIEGSYPFAAPRDVVWPILTDPVVLASVMPGCETLETVGENQYHGILKIKVGPVQGKFQGDIVLADINSPESYNITVNGRGAPGFVKGTGSLRLEADGDMTTLHYSGDAQVGGRLASVGQRLLDTSANAIIRQSLEGLGQQVQARMMADVSGELGIGEAPPRPIPPSQVQFAAGVAKNLVEEYLAPDQRDNLIKIGLMFLGALMLAQLVSNWLVNKIAREVANRIAKEDGN
jgi:uncharacterized protein